MNHFPATHFYISVFGVMVRIPCLASRISKVMHPWILLVPLLKYIHIQET